MKFEYNPSNFEDFVFKSRIQLMTCFYELSRLHVSEKCSRETLSNIQSIYELKSTIE